MRVTRGKGFAKDPCSIPVEERPELCTLLLEGRHRIKGWSLQTLSAKPCYLPRSAFLGCNIDDPPFLLQRSGKLKIFFCQPFIARLYHHNACSFANAFDYFRMLHHIVIELTRKLEIFLYVLLTHSVILKRNIL